MKQRAIRPVPELDESGPAHDLARLIESLDRHGVDYLLAGGGAARAYGATGMSDDEARLLPVQLDGTMLAGADISTWMTDAGGFDVLPGLVGADRRLLPFEELATRERLIDGEGFTIRAAALEDIITAKEHTDRPKDREALPELRALRDGPTTP